MSFLDTLQALQRRQEEQYSADRAKLHGAARALMSYIPAQMGIPEKMTRASGAEFKVLHFDWGGHGRKPDWNELDIADMPERADGIVPVAMLLGLPSVNYPIYIDIALRIQGGEVEYGEWRRPSKIEVPYNPGWTRSEGEFVNRIGERLEQFFQHRQAEGPAPVTCVSRIIID